MKYRHRWWDPLGFPHRMIFDKEHIFQQGQFWVKLDENSSEGQGLTFGHKSVVQWLNDLPGKGALGLEPAWRFNFGRNEIYTLWPWGSNQNLALDPNFGIDFTRASDAMMFKIRFNNFNSGDDLDLDPSAFQNWLPLVRPRPPQSNIRRRTR